MTDPGLQQRLAHIAELEAQLEAARASARTLAKICGRGTANLFGETNFVPRGCTTRARKCSTTARLATKAYRRGVKAGREEEEAKNLKFLKVAALVNEASRTGDWSKVPTDDGKPFQPGKYAHLRELCRVAREQRERELARSEADAEPPAAPDPQRLAQQILAAGAKHRGETPPLPPVGSLARRILDAGMKRRGQDPTIRPRPRKTARARRTPTTTKSISSRMTTNTGTMRASSTTMSASAAASAARRRSAIPTSWATRATLTSSKVCPRKSARGACGCGSRRRRRRGLTARWSTWRMRSSTPAGARGACRH